MKIPHAPPTPVDVVTAALRKNPKRFPDFMRRADIVDEKGRYLHWDELRYKKPPPGLSGEEWWAVTRMARHAAGQSLPLVDKDGKAFSFCEPPALKAALRELDMNAGGALATETTALSAGEGRQYLVRSLAEEPFASSFIEGAATTRQIAKKLIFEGRAPRTKDERMVLNNYRAMEFIKACKDDSLTVDMLAELHRIVCGGTLDNLQDAGRIRTADNIQVVDDTSGEVLHQPPPAVDLPKRLAALILFANEKPAVNHWVHPLTKAFILHFMLSYEHPFVDGNGRVARALFYWAALRENYWLMEYVSISSVIAEKVVAYGKTFLHVETDDADLTYFLIYHAEILQTAVLRLGVFAAQKRKEVAAMEKRLTDKRRPDAFNHRQSWLLNEFARRRLSTVKVGEYQMRNGVSYLTARNDLESLTAAGFLQKTKSGKTSIYRPVFDFVKRLTSGT
jgi:Fic family protein